MAVWAPNSAAWEIAALAAQSAGAILVPLNTRWKAREAEWNKRLFFRTGQVSLARAWTENLTDTKRVFDKLAVKYEVVQHDDLVRRYRTRHGNSTFGKQDFARGLLAAMKAGETVGVLMDTNMTPPQGVFVEFFGRLACTPSGIARVALRTGAAVVPAFTIWDEQLGKYKIRFDPALELVSTGDDDADALTNTALCTRHIESYIRRFPDQWLWVHRRWR